MTHTRRFYAHSDDAHAAHVVLESFGLQSGVIVTTVDSEGGLVDEYEVWCVVPTIRISASRPVADTEPDEHDRGRSTLWDEEHEQREWHE